jgi:Zn-dependent protease/predicted transcriptional regulator
MDPCGYFPDQYKELTRGTYWLMGVFGAIGLFFSIVFHEFCHSFVARKRGIPMKGITLFIFGGIAEMDEQPPDPGTEFLMAVVGPLSSILIGLIFLGIYTALNRGEFVTPLFGVIRYLGMINLILAGFNLLPAFPLDGGRIFRAALWAWKKDIRSATRIAYQIGNGFGWILIFLGFLNIISGHFITGIWWIMIGFFLKSASQMSYRQVLLRKTLEGEKVRDFMKENPVTVTPDTTIDELIHHVIYKHHYKMYPVVDDGHLIGTVHLRQIKDIPETDRLNRTVRAITTPCSENCTIHPDEDVMHALSKMQKNKTGRLIVIEHEKLAGIISLRDIMNVLSLKIDFHMQ